MNLHNFLRILYVVIPVGIFVCVIGQMIISNQMIVYSNTLGRINQRIAEINSQNTILKQKLVQRESIQYLSQEAKRFGFVEPTSYLAYTSDSYPIAIKR